MSQNIVLLSDGTGNSAAKVWRTNVWRTFEALDLSGSDQVAFYDDGVGTSSFKPWQKCLNFVSYIHDIHDILEFEETANHQILLTAKLRFPTMYF